MIRLNKPVKLYEWGKGTNTTNQIWTPIGEGKIVESKMKDGVTVLTVELNSAAKKENSDDSSVKVMQQGEGMTACSDHWGEVAMGFLKSLESGGRTVNISIPYATKIAKR